jgi:hypothetical protein
MVEQSLMIPSLMVFGDMDEPFLQYMEKTLDTKKTPFSHFLLFLLMSLIIFQKI